MNVAIVGLGLIGGSMAKSIKNRTSHTVWGIDLNAETMTMARMCGAIDAPLTEENLPQADLILVAIRPGAAIEWVRQHAPQIAKTAILVDLCGVKRTVVAAIAPIAEERGFSYIGGHPMAGKERGEKEQGERKLLNLGHTVGHAIEKCSGYVIPHGHAVAAGLAVIARAAEALGWTEESLAARITACLSKNGLPTGTDYSAEALAEAALSDKKRAGGDITLVVPRKIGHCELRKVPVADLLPIIRAGLEA